MRTIKCQLSGLFDRVIHLVAKTRSLSVLSWLIFIHREFVPSFTLTVEERFVLSSLVIQMKNKNMHAI